MSAAHPVIRRPFISALRLLPILLAFLSVPNAARAQLPDSVQLVPGDAIYEVRLQDGSLLYGQIVSAEAQRIVFLTQAGVRVELNRAQIQEVGPVRGTVRTDGVIWPEDPNSTRLFFGPTGRALAAGEAYLGAFELFLPFVAVGLTDWLTIAGGTPILPEVIGRVVYLAPRLQIVRTNRVQLSTGALAFFDATGDSGDEPNTVGIFFGAGTVGSPDNALTVGAGWGFAGSDVENRPALLIGGEARVGRRVKLITENYYVSLDDEFSESGHIALMGAGIRLFGERLAGDLGLGFGMGEADFACCIPLVNFVYNFGAGR